MMGAGLLYHLAKEGWTDLVLVEKGELTSGSTWHAAGQCPSFIADYNMAKIHHYGNVLYPELEDITGQYVSWHGCGGIRFALNDVELDWFRHVESISKTIGFEVHIISPEEVKKYNPYVDTKGVIAGALTIGDGHVDPAGCCNALAKGARDLGATIYRNNRVLDINLNKNGEWEILTEKGNLCAEHVVNASGCYARQISRMVGSDVPITNMEHHYLVTEAVPEFVEDAKEMPVMRDPYPSAYYRQEQNSGLIGIYETHSGSEAWSYRGGWPEWESENELFDPEFERIAPYVERVMERMPIWANAGIKRIVHGAIPHTPDANPLVGPAMGLRNFWQCCGSAIGIAQGAGCGKYLAQWMVHGDAEINMSGLDPRRYCGMTDEKWVRKKSYQDYTHMYKLHLPGEERPAGRGVRVSSLFSKLEKKGAVYGESAAWERPKWFSLDGSQENPSFHHNNIFQVIAAECTAVRERVGILDLSSFAKFLVSGPNALTFLDRIVPNTIPRQVGGVILTHFLGNNGMIRGEVTLSRVEENTFFLLSGASAQHRDFDHIAMSVKKDESVTVIDVTDDKGALVLAGPRSRDVLSRVTKSDLSNEKFKWLTCQEIEISGMQVLALRINYLGELGWELHCSMGDLPELYDVLWSAGSSFQIADVGLYALNSLRLEKGYKGWGTELTNEISLIEAGMERFIKWNKGDFTGRCKTLEKKKSGVTGKIVYCELEKGDCDVSGGEVIRSGSRVIGIATSGGYGHYTEKSLFFSYVDNEFSSVGTTFEVNVLGIYRQATVLSDAVWDPENNRLSN